MFDNTVAFVLVVYLLGILVAAFSALLIRITVALLSIFDKKETGTDASPQPAASDAVPARHLAIIAAAVYQATSGARIVRISSAESSRAWAIAGRLAHHASHTPTPH